MKKIKHALILLFILIFGLFIILLIGNDYQMIENNVEIRTINKLSGVVTIPKNKKAKGIIIFVHGDGAQNATQNGGYKPLMERFAKQGFISVSWDKPGVGHSTGNWLNQSMTDRALEVSKVIDWAQKKYPTASKKIGLWGASQAGWVIPKVMINNPIVDFSILVGPAINWKRQGMYDTEWRLRDKGASKTKIDEEKENFISDAILIEKNETYANYKKNGGKETLSADRYLFIKRNMESDATSELLKIKNPIYLVLAEHDKNVDSQETKKIYQTSVNNKKLQIKTIPDTEHMMINPYIGNSKVLTTLAAIFLPKYCLIDKDYLNYCEYIVSLNSDS